MKRYYGVNGRSLKATSMIDPVAAMVDAATKWLNGPIGLATALLMLLIVAFAIMVFLRSCESKTMSGFVRFMVSIGTLTHASARTDFLFWTPRKFLTLLMAVPAGASITVACSYASHAVLATAFGDARHISDRLFIALSALFMITTLLACAPVQFGIAQLEITSRQRNHAA